jgi:hypothetical protein
VRKNAVLYYLFVQNLAFLFEIVMCKYQDFVRIRYSDNLGLSFLPESISGNAVSEASDRCLTCMKLFGIMCT